MRLSALPLIALLSLFAVPALAQECGDADTPCEIQSGTYHIAMPDVASLKGIVVHLHGGGARGRGLLKSGLGKEAVARGYVFVAPNGYHPGARFVHNWSVKAKGTNYEGDDLVFLRDVLADVREKTGLEDAPVMLAGFSRGASMAWDVACYDPNFADAYAPVAGAFWDDMPESCAAPVRMFHTHGWTDRTVPLEGRSLRAGTVVQGDVWESLKILRATNGCEARQPESSSFEGDLWLRHWTDCDAGEIQLMLHKGGHGAPKGWGPRMLDWFEGQTG